MIHSLCENYGWSYAEAMKVTMNQMILMSHASSVSYERIKAKSDKKDTHTTLTADKIMVSGKSLDQLNSDELASYYLTNNVEGGFGNINIIE